MQAVLARIAAAIGVFVGTNVDDLVVLTVLFLACRAAKQPRPWRIWAGQFLGIAALVSVSALAALGLTVVPERWVGLLGIVPLALGVKGLIEAAREDSDDASPGISASGVLSVAGVTVANGADNLSVYTPMFRAIGLAQSAITVAVFAVMTALWCAAGSWLGGRKRVIDAVERYGRWMVPAVFITIGAVILAGLRGR